MKSCFLCSSLRCCCFNNYGQDFTTGPGKYVGKYVLVRHFLLYLSRKRYTLFRLTVLSSVGAPGSIVSVSKC